MEGGGKGGFGTAEEAWWGVLRDLGSGQDESAVPTALAALRNAVRPPLPKMVRPDIVRDVCSFLVAPSEKVSLRERERKRECVCMCVLVWFPSHRMVCYE